MSARDNFDTLGARILLGLFLCCGSWSVCGQGNLLRNGSFEQGWNNGPIGWGWTTDVALANGYPGAADGTSFAILNGTLFQDVATSPGQAYRVQYAVSGNSSFAGVLVIGLTWGGSFIGNTTWTSPNTPGNGLNFNWVYANYTVIAAANSTRIGFQGLGHPFLDAVSVTPVPEPSTSTFLVLSLVMFSSFAHRRMKR